MIKSIVGFDICLIYCVFEPIMFRMQKWSGRNNFWWARQFIIVSHILLLMYAIFLIVYTNMKFAGMLGAICVMIGSSTVSIKLWKFFVKKTRRPRLRHFTQRERDSAIYYAYHGMRNPLEFYLLRVRLRKYAELCVITIMMGFAFYLKSEYLLVFYAMMIHVITITMWMYMRSCTPFVKQL
jgi:hypothetical protein